MNHSMPDLPCPSPALRVYSNPCCSSSRWYHPTISSSVIPFSSCPQSFLASGSFPMSPLFTWGGQSIGVSASASVLPMNTQDWSHLGWTGWISLQSKGLSRVFSNHHSSKASILQCSASFIVQLSHPYMTTGKTIASGLSSQRSRQTFVGKVMSLLFNMLSRLVIHVQNHTCTHRASKSSLFQLSNSSSCSYDWIISISLTVLLTNLGHKTDCRTQDTVRPHNLERIFPSFFWVLCFCSNSLAYISILKASNTVDTYHVCSQLRSIELQSKLRTWKTSLFNLILWVWPILSSGEIFLDDDSFSNGSPS